MPYENQAVDWVEEIRNRYYFVHEHSDGVDFARFDYQPNCYNIADRIMANKSNRLLVFGGEKDNYSILEYAQEKGVNTKLFEEFY